MASGPAQAVDEYWEYTRIVGGDDGGKTFSPAEFERYKKEVIPMRIKNRLFVSWTNPKGMDCKLVGPETFCFCMHRYRAHETDLKQIPEKRPINVKCREKGCKCRAYLYLPWSGGGPIRCSGCKHSGKEHSEAQKHPCKNERCKCEEFHSSYTCQCGEGYSKHVMIVETKDERIKRGRPVGHDVPYQAMGGVTGFSSLQDGYMRMDASGIGAPDEAILNQPITDQDLPFLRMHKSAIETLESKAEELSLESAKFKKRRAPGKRSKTPSKD